jgi:L-ascorbate metabolism protein UlaG (beta-lactamase superfamily)
MICERTVEKTKACLVIPVHWGNFFASMEKPVDENAGIH